MKIQHVDHVGINVENLEPMKDFFMGMGIYRHGPNRHAGRTCRPSRRPEKR